VRSKKTASSSITSFLSHFGDIVIEAPPPNTFYTHMTAKEIHKEIPHLWNEYFTFSVVRHPIEKMISEYYYSNRFNEYLDFSHFIRRPHIRGTMNCDVLDTSHIKNFDYMIKYESLYEQLRDVLNILGVPYNNLDLPFEKSEYRLNRSPWYEFVNQEDLKYIKNHFARELDFHRQFGYVYDVIVKR
jgi:hypothetical protein